RLGRELEVRPLDDGVDGAGLLAQAAIDALGHVDVVTRGATTAVLPRLGLDGDGERRADRLAQLAGNAALLAVRVASQRMLATEAWAEGSLLEGVVECNPRPEHVAEGEAKAGQQLCEEQPPRGAIEECHACRFSYRTPRGTSGV